MKIFLFLFNNEFGTRDHAINIIKQLPTVVSWRSDLPNTIYIKSESSPQQLCDDIRAIRGVGKFLIAELTNNRQGYLSKETWNFLKMDLL